MKRKWKLPLKYNFDSKLLLRNGDRVYEVVENRAEEPMPPLNIILLDTLEGKVHVITSLILSN